MRAHRSPQVFPLSAPVLVNRNLSARVYYAGGGSRRHPPAADGSPWPGRSCGAGVGDLCAGQRRVRAAGGWMTTLLDLLFVASFAVAFPLFDYLVSWPAFRRRSRVDPARARMSLWKQTTVDGWALVAVGTALWVTHDRSWESFGFSVPNGWRLWASLALLLLVVAYRSSGSRPLPGAPSSERSFASSSRRTAAFCHARRPSCAGSARCR